MLNEMDSTFQTESRPVVDVLEMPAQLPNSLFIFALCAACAERQRQWPVACRVLSDGHGLQVTLAEMPTSLAGVSLVEIADTLMALLRRQMSDFTQIKNALAACTTLCCDGGQLLAFNWCCEAGYVTGFTDTGAAHQYSNFLPTALALCATVDKSLYSPAESVKPALQQALLNNARLQSGKNPAVHSMRLIERFWRQVDISPDAVALEARDQQFTFSDIRRAVVALSQQLVRQVAPGARVGVYIERSEYTLVAMLSCLYAGAVYMPLDTKYPLAHVRQLALQTQPALILSSAMLLGDDAETSLSVPVMLLDTELFSATTDAPVFLPQAILPAHAQPFALLFTSGSTGRAKAVLHSEQSFIERFEWQWSTMALQPDDVFCQRTTVNFGPHIWEFLFGLLHGCRTVIIDDATQRSATAFLAALSNSGITRLALVPSFLRTLLVEARQDGLQFAPGLRSIAVAGELVTPEFVEQIHAELPGVTLYNDYGSTETNCIFFHALQPGTAAVTLGRVSPAACIRVVTELGQLAAPYQAGTLLVGGATLALGTISEQGDLCPLETSEPLVGESVGYYVTGDRAYYTFAGEVVILGRSGSQVKIRGMRVNLDSLTEQYRKVLEENQLALLVQKRKRGENRLIAFVKHISAGTVSLAEKQRAFERLRGQLPEYFLPAYIHYVDVIPHLLNGKLDKLTLENLLTGASAGTVGYSVREQLAGLIRELVELPLTEVELFNAAFCDIGVDSLVATQLLQAINTRFQIKLSVQEFLQHWDFPSLHRLLTQKLQRAEAPIALRSQPTPDDDLRHLRQICAAYQPWSEEDTHDGEEAVLVTGATGHIGINVLWQLLQETSQRVFTIVRPGSLGAHKRIAGAFNRYGLSPDQEQMERLIVLEGDLELAQFGLDDPTFTHLAGQVSCVVHLAADVNHMAGYSALRGALVRSWANLLHFCTCQRIKKVVQASSIAALLRQDGGVHRGESLVPEWQTIASGYGICKWLGEQVLDSYVATTPASAISLRFGEIGGSATGLALPVNDLVHQFLQLLEEFPPTHTILQMELAQKVVDILPVDWAAQFVSRLVTTSVQGHALLNVTHPQPASLGDFFNGHAAATTAVADAVPFAHWLQSLNRFVQQYRQPLLNGIELFFESNADHALWLDYFSDLKLDQTLFMRTADRMGMSSPENPIALVRKIIEA